VELQHTFTVPAPVDRAWSTLLDIEGVAPCFPGASLTTVEGDEFSGTVKVKLGPVSLQYAGRGRFVERDEAARRVVLEANGTDKRGNGTAGATVQARLEPDGDSGTRVVVDTDLKVTGRPAQFGRGVLQDVGGKIIEQFAGCLASRMSSSQAAGVSTPEQAATSTPEPAAASSSRSAIADDPALARLEELGEPGRRLGVPAEGESAAVTRKDWGAASTSSLADSGRRSTASSGPPPVTSSGPHAAAAAELDLGAVVLPSLVRRYGRGVLAGLVAVLVVWLLRRRAR
jgi:uncharacterized protein